jgi:general secretion pathway protein J
MAGRWRLSGISRRNSGFTLLEVLIAIVLLGILSAALYGSYFGVIRARDRASAGMESQRELGATIDLIRREVSSAMISRDPKKQLHFVVLDRDNFGAPASTLELTTLLPPDAQVRGESGIVDVIYQITKKDTKFILTRQEQDLIYINNVNTSASTGTNTDVNTATNAGYPQMEQINSFLVECYDGSKWVKTWNSDTQGLPQSVRVTVQVDDRGKPVEFSVVSTPRVIQQ